jgi:hypothetical protein
MLHLYALPNRGPRCVCGHDKFFHEARYVVIDGTPCKSSGPANDIDAGSCKPWLQTDEGEFIMPEYDDALDDAPHCNCAAFLEWHWSLKKALKLGLAVALMLPIACLLWKRLDQGLTWRSSALDALGLTPWTLGAAVLIVTAYTAGAMDSRNQLVARWRTVASR